MIEFVRTDRYPFELLDSWLKADPYHQDSNLSYWKPNGKEILACWIKDKIGPTMYLKLDTEARLVRMHVQFAPEAEVSKSRVARTILQAWPRIVSLVNIPDVEGVAFESVSPELVRFMYRMGFREWKEQDYLYSFREK